MTAGGANIDNWTIEEIVEVVAEFEKHASST
jgi:hypothetical protein